jgi:hypothetical protein
MEDQDDGSTTVYSRGNRWYVPSCSLLQEQMMKWREQLSSRRSAKSDAGLAWHNAGMVQGRPPPSSAEYLQNVCYTRDRHIHRQAWNAFPFFITLPLIDILSQ